MEALVEVEFCVVFLAARGIRFRSDGFFALALERLERLVLRLFVMLLSWIHSPSKITGIRETESKESHT